MASEDSQPTTPVRTVASVEPSSVSPLVSSPASSSMSPDISSFLRTFRQAHAGENAAETLDTQMAKKRKERDEAKTKANEVKQDLKKCVTKRQGR